MLIWLAYRNGNCYGEIYLLWILGRVEFIVVVGWWPDAVGIYDDDISYSFIFGIYVGFKVGESDL